MWICSFFLLYNTHLLKNLHNTDCEFYFIARNIFSINFTFFSICFYYALNILTTQYRIGSWNATRTYPVQCWHDMKVSLFVRSEDYTKVRDQDFHRAGCFEKHFIYDTLKKAPQFFFLNTLKIAFWIRA